MKYGILLLLFILITGCSNNKVSKNNEIKKNNKVKSSKNTLQLELTEENLKLAIKNIISKMNSAQWYKDFTKINDKRPIFRIEKFQNRTEIHIGEPFLTIIKREILLGNKIKLISSNKRAEVLDKQFKGYNPHKNIANFVLSGYILNKNEEYYEITLELYDSKTNKRIWIGKDRIKDKVVLKRDNW